MAHQEGGAFPALGGPPGPCIKTLPPPPSGRLPQVRQALGSIYAVDQYRRLVAEHLLPWAFSKFAQTVARRRAAAAAAAAAAAGGAAPAANAAAVAAAAVSEGLAPAYVAFVDCSEMAVQAGYVTMFACGYESGRQ